jgi:hypothetical protein
MKHCITAIGVFLIVCNALIAQSWGDYTFYSVQGGTTAYLIDNSKNVYHSWTFSSSAKTGYSSYLLDGGTVLRTVSHSGNQLNGSVLCGEIQKVDWDGNVTWDYVYSSSTYCTHHDICPLPNGNVLLISYDVKTATDASNAGCTLNTSIWSDKIVEVKQTGTTTGEVVWEWKAWDHLCQNNSSSKNNYVSSIVEHPELLNVNYKIQQDWIHMNGIDYNSELDQIVFSSHYLNELYVIDHSTSTEEAATHAGGNSGKGGDFLYRWGNPAAYGASGTTVFNVVHDAHWVPAGYPRGNYLVGFNNNGVSTSKSSIDLISPPYNGYTYSITSGAAYTPSTYTTRYQCKGHTSDMGNSQQLPNGNSLICISQSGYIYEIDSTGSLLWSTTISGIVPKAFRYSAAYVAGTDTATATTSISSASSSTIYPNPTSGTLSIVLNNLVDESFETSVFDISGRKIIQTSNASTIDMSAFGNGVYFLVVKSKGNIIVKSKIILMK